MTSTRTPRWTRSVTNVELAARNSGGAIVLRDLPSLSMTPIDGRRTDLRDLARLDLPRKSEKASIGGAGARRTR